MRARTAAQLVARIDSHLRSRDGWMAENKRSNDLLGQVDTRDRVKSWGRGKGTASDVERGAGRADEGGWVGTTIPSLAGRSSARRPDPQPRPAL